MKKKSTFVSSLICMILIVVLGFIAFKIIINSKSESSIAFGDKNVQQEEPEKVKKLEVSEKDNNTVIDIKEKEFEELIRNIINKPQGDIQISDIKTYEETMTYGYDVKISGHTFPFEVSVSQDGIGLKSEIVCKVEDLNYIKYIPRVRSLSIAGIELQDLSFLQELKHVGHFSSFDSKIVSLSSLKSMSKVTHLTIDNSDIDDISAISELASLKSFRYRGGSAPRYITEIKNSNSLNILDLSYCKLVDISELSGLVELKSLILNNNQISEIHALRNMTKLSESLRLENNKITDISPLEKLSSIKYLDISNNNIVDISPLELLSNIEDLYIYNNNIVDIYPLKGLINLKRLDISGNSISNISTLKDLVKLNFLNIANNLIEDFTPIEGLINTEVLK